MHNKSELFKKKLIDYFSDIVESHKRHLDSLRKDDFKRSYFKGKKINPKKTTKNQKDLFNKKFNKFKRDQLNKYSTKKYHFENFPLYLKVYDFRKSGMSWSKIVEVMNLNSIQAARNYYNAALKIIDGGVDLYIK